MTAALSNHYMRNHYERTAGRIGEALFVDVVGKTCVKLPRGCGILFLLFL